MGVTFLKPPGISGKGNGHKKERSSRLLSKSGPPKVSEHGALEGILLGT